MFWKMVFLTVFVVGSVSVGSGQTSAKVDARALLNELDSMLTEIPETKEECQALLKEIKSWQQKKLRELRAPKPMLSITAPDDKAHVSDRPIVEGTVADPTVKVWVVVHPMEVSDYWVQPGIIVRKDGTWRVMLYIGRPGKIDVGKRFEIMAVANPTVNLSEGKILSGWPEARWRSQVLEVVRK